MYLLYIFIILAYIYIYITFGFGLCLFCVLEQGLPVFSPLLHSNSWQFSFLSLSSFYCLTLSHGASVEWAFKSSHDASEMDSEGREPPLFTGRMFRESSLLPQGHLLICMGGWENNNAYFIGSLGGLSCQIGIIIYQPKLEKESYFSCSKSIFISSLDMVFSLLGTNIT